MSTLLSLLHYTALVLGVVTWTVGGVWLARTALVEGKTRSLWQASSLLLLWPLLCMAFAFQLVWQWLVDE